MSERHAYFFKGAGYLRYNIDTDLRDVGPVEISTFWKELPEEFQSGNFDAVVNWGNSLNMSERHAYFFKGARYLRYNIDRNVVDVPPVEISTNWKELPEEFQSGNFDAVVNWGDGHAYFFKGARYLRYNIDREEVDVLPVEISTNWKDLPENFQSDFDDVVNWGDGHAYFFKGAGYLRYNIDTDLPDVGPVEISTFWKHLPEEFQSGNFDAVVNWSPNLTLHWENIPRDRRMVEVMERLHDIYEYPVNAAAGIVGNLLAESFVIPTCVQGAAEGSPMRARNFQGQTRQFTAEEIKNRNEHAQIGPEFAGAGLAQWTRPDRRAGLFKHPFRGSALGFRVLFNLDAQIDYLVHELRSPGFAQAQQVLTDPAVTANAASDAVLLHFEIPEFAAQKVNQRRNNTQAALNAFRAVHP